MRLSLSLIILSVFAGCAPTIERPPTQIDGIFGNNFQNISIPEFNIKEIEQRGESRGYPYANFDDVWDSATAVLIQQGVIVRGYKDQGLIVVITAWPFALLIEKGEPVTVYLNWMEYLYTRLDNPDAKTLEFEPDKKKETAKSIFDQLATQLYSGKKWGYLHDRPEADKQGKD